MPSAEAMMMLEPKDLNDPWTFAYDVKVPWGYARIELNVDILFHITSPYFLQDFAEALYATAIAPAMNFQTYLDLVWPLPYRQAADGRPFAPSSTHRGHVGGTPSSRDHSPLVILHTGHSDNYAARRLYLPASLASWSAEGLLTDRGWDSLLTWAQSLGMGALGAIAGGQLQLLTRYKDVVPFSLENTWGMAFRRVTHIKVLQYTDRCPDMPTGIFPWQ